MYLKLKTNGTKTFGLSEDRKRISSSVSTTGYVFIYLHMYHITQASFIHKIIPKIICND